MKKKDASHQHVGKTTSTSQSNQLNTTKLDNQIEKIKDLVKEGKFLEYLKVFNETPSLKERLKIYTEVVIDRSIPASKVRTFSKLIHGLPEDDTASRLSDEGEM